MKFIKSQVGALSVLHLAIFFLSACSSTPATPKADPFPMVMRDRCYWRATPAHLTFYPHTSRLSASSLTRLTKFGLRSRQEHGEIVILLQKTAFDLKDKLANKTAKRRTQMIRTFLHAYGVVDHDITYEADDAGVLPQPGDDPKRIEDSVQVYNLGFGRACIQQIRDEFKQWKDRNCLVLPQRASEEECEKIQHLMEHTPY